MPQYFQVLRCFMCSIFQIHQVKKSNKFECKMCGEKQSVKRHYGIGTGKECRIHVQKLNGIRGVIDNNKNSLSSDEENVEDIEYIDANKQQLLSVKGESKWSEYIEEPVCPDEKINDDISLCDAEVVLERPAKRRKFTRNNARNKKSSYKHDDSEELTPGESPSKNTIGKHNAIDVVYNSIKFESEIASTSKSIPLKFVPPTCTKQSKWAQFTDEVEDLPDNNDKEEKSFVAKNTSLETTPIVSDKNTLQKKETVNKFSKWDFHISTEKPDIVIPKFNVPVSVSKSKNPTQKLFSLCNDNDLDIILDI